MPTKSTATAGQSCSSVEGVISRVRSGLQGMVVQLGVSMAEKWPGMAVIWRQYGQRLPKNWARSFEANHGDLK